MILDGKQTARKIEEDLGRKIGRLENKPCLAVVLVGKNPGSKVYVNMKTLSCDRVGIESRKHELAEDVSEEELLKLVEELNNDDSVHGILVQLPLPEHVNEDKVIQAISPEKDVDGFHPVNAGRLAAGQEAFIPCTPKGIIRLLKNYGIQIQGKDAVVIGRSNIVGKPVALLLLQEGATVTICHSKTADLGGHTRRADILVAAIGRPQRITADMVKEGAVVVDVGINRVEDKHVKKGYRLAGDVDFEGVNEKASAITPVPGGVGPMTVAMLMENAYEAFLKQNGGV